MTALSPIGLGLSVAGQLTGGLQALQAGKAQGRVDDENARLALLGGEQEALQSRRDERMQSGDMIAAMGGSGIQLGSGSAADVLAESAYQRELEILNIRTKATRQANGLYQQGADARAAGQGALVQSIFSAGATALKGAADTRAQRTAQQQVTDERQSMGGGTRAVPAMRVRGLGR